MQKKSTFTNAIKREFNNTYDTVETLRGLSEAANALREPAPGISGMLANGLRALKQEIRLGLLFGALLLLKLTLVVVFNVAAVLLLFWLLSVL